jgi:hypothetical protein
VEVDAMKIKLIAPHEQSKENISSAETFKTMFGLPKQGYFKRMGVYFKERFPISFRFASSILLYISFISFLGRIHGIKLSIFSSYTLVGTWSIFSIMLILRLMDELMDKEIDIELFPDRSFPSGKVLESDIRFSLAITIILYLCVNIFLSQVLWIALFVLGFSLLMTRYFFIPRMRRYPLLNLATHNLIIPIIFFYFLMLFLAQYDLKLKNLDRTSTFLLIGMYWAMFFAWEIARKIRSREEENAYVTYSQIFGPLGAVLVAVGAQTITFFIGLYFFWALSHSTILLLILLTGYLVTIWGHMRFVNHPNPVTSKLKPFAEGFILSILSAEILNQILLVG